MKILCIGDIHNDKNFQSKLNKILDDHSDIQNILVHGDMAGFGSYEEAVSIIDQGQALAKEKWMKIYFNVGNCDPKGAIEVLQERDVHLHLKLRSLEEGINVFGLGGSNTTPFNCPIEFSDAQIKEFLQKADDSFSEGEFNILISHFPPHNTKLDLIPDGGIHVGSTVLRSYLEKTSKISMVVGGHIHESKSHDTVNDIPCFNTGPFNQGDGLILNIQNNKFDYKFI